MTIGVYPGDGGKQFWIALAVLYGPEHIHTVTHTRLVSCLVNIIG